MQSIFVSFAVKLAVPLPAAREVSSAIPLLLAHNASERLSTWHNIDFKPTPLNYLSLLRHRVCE